MQRVTPHRRWPLFDVAATRAIERSVQASLVPHALMQRAGLAGARLAIALAPYAKTFWIACGPGNNGGDGFEAAMHLKQWGKEPIVTWLGDEASAPLDALASLQRARGAGVTLTALPPPQWDFALDALVGLGLARPLDGRAAEWAALLNGNVQRVLAVDVPSGLNANTGAAAGVHAAHTLSLLTLKPGLFTGTGRDASGTVWFDDLGVAIDRQPVAWLSASAVDTPRAHSSHKGSYGDVAVVGGAPGMAGAALLAASAALHSGAGRVFVSLLNDDTPTVDTAQPDLMFRRWDSLDFAALAVVCGCGGGDAVRAVLPKTLSTARTLVLDADALNAVAADPQLQSLLQARSRRGRPTVLTPHPLEAARLLGTSTAQVQQDRLAAAAQLVQRFGSSVVLKGSGTVVAAPEQLPLVNPTGSARLAIAGTGDVLAGMIAARLANGANAFDAAASAVYAHGLAADRWRTDRPLTANALAHGWVAGPPHDDEI